MLQLTPKSVIFIATIAVDFRKGIDGLVAICKLKLSTDPFNGTIFLFYNKSKTTIKILSFDGQGFWLCTKRLSKGKFIAKLKSQSPYYQVCYRVMHILTSNGEPTSVKIAKDWRPIN